MVREEQSTIFFKKGFNTEKVPQGTTATVAREHHVSEKTVCRIWQCEKISVENGAPAAYVSSRRKGNCCREQMNLENL